MCKFESMNGVVISYKQIHQAMKMENESFYKMNLVGRDKEFVMQAVNQGIDSYLEACFVPARGDSFEHTEDGRLLCKVSPESLPVLLRRLYEMPCVHDDENEDDVCYLLADDILSTLGINIEGKYVGREALGLE